MSWQLAKQLPMLNPCLTVPDPWMILVLTTDASKIAGAACLIQFRENTLQLVSVTSKHFSIVNLNKHS
jgi:hypothetical protein